MKSPRFPFVLLLMFLSIGGAASAQQPSSTAQSSTPAPPPSPFADKLTRDWGGARSDMASHGVLFELDIAHYYQGLISGTNDPSDGEDDFAYGGRLDSYLTLDTEKLGWWRGGSLRAHAELYFGDLNPTLGGTLVPTNLGVRLPNGGGDIEATSIYLAQRFGKRVNLMVGKINTVDLLLTHPFFGGAGYLRAHSLAFAAPPNGLLPPVIGGAIVSVGTSPVSWTFMVYDPEDRTLQYWMRDLFSTGVNLSVGAKHSSRLAGRTTAVTVTGIYSTKDGVNLGEVLLPPELTTGALSSSWHASVQFDHFLVERPERPGTGWGVFVKVGASDGNPNPYQAFITGGIGGKGLFRSRPNDGFAVGYFNYNLSDALQNSISPLVKFDDEQGLEVYYDVALAPGLRLAGDLQYSNPAKAANKNAFVGGVRLTVRF
jgi:porin